MAVVANRWRLRPFDPPADRALVEALWRSALQPQWPLLPDGIAMLRDGFIVVDGARVAGFAAVDMAGSIPLLMVDPACQRRGIGSMLLAAASRRLGAAGVREVTAGSGGTGYIWPGVPLNLPAAVRFFSACGWETRGDTLDLIADLRTYRPPAGAYKRAARAGVAITQADGSDPAAVLAFETATFPSWARWFQPSDQHILLARDDTGAIAGTLLFEGPGASTVFRPLLGPAAGTIGCVGVAPPWQGRGIGTAMVARATEILSAAGTGSCHIGWTVRESFYARAGYKAWRRYRMFHRATGQPPPP
jgi:ribosomal protein S18 acetylase RimI-like enzyme